MDINEVMQLISNVGFPIVVAGALFFYVDKLNSSHDEQERQLRETLYTMEKGWQEALSNNTLVMHELLHEIKELRGSNGSKNATN